MYKKEKTTYVVRNIPVSLWKKVRGKFLTEPGNKKGLSELIISLLKDWVGDE